MNFTKKTQPPHNLDTNHYQQIRSLLHNFLLPITYPFLTLHLGTITKDLFAYVLLPIDALYSVDSSVSVFFHSIFYLWDASTSLQVAVIHSFSLLYSTSTSQCIYPFIFNGHLDFFPTWGCYEHSCTCFGAHIYNISVEHITRREILGLQEKHIFNF